MFLDVEYHIHIYICIQIGIAPLYVLYTINIEEHQEGSYRTVRIYIYAIERIHPYVRSIHIFVTTIFLP